MTTASRDSIVLKHTRHATRESWLLDRTKSLGASDDAKLMGLSPWGGAASVYAAKLGLLSDGAAESEAAEWGLYMEPGVAARYMRETGLTVQDPGRYTIVRNLAYPHLHATIDRYVTHPTRGRGVLELKTASAWKAGEWVEEAPAAYMVQLQHQLLVTGLHWGAIAVLIGGQTFRYIDCIERDDQFCQELLVMTERFWGYVERAVLPPVDASEACTRLLKELYPKESGATIELADPKLLQADALYTAAVATLKLAEQEKDLAENTFRQALGDASKGVLPNGIAYTLKTEHRKEHVREAWTGRVLRRSKKG